MALYMKPARNRSHSIKCRAVLKRLLAAKAQPTVEQLRAQGKALATTLGKA